MRRIQLRTTVLESDAAVEVVPSGTGAFFQWAPPPAAPPRRWNLFIVVDVSELLSLVSLHSVFVG